MTVSSYFSSQYVINHLGQLSRLPLQGRQVKYRPAPV